MERLIIHAFYGSFGTMIWGSMITFFIVTSNAKILGKIKTSTYVKYLLFAWLLSSLFYFIFSIIFPTYSLVMHGPAENNNLLDLIIPIAIGYAIDKPLVRRMGKSLTEESKPINTPPHKYKISKGFHRLGIVIGTLFTLSWICWVIFEPDNSSMVLDPRGCLLIIFWGVVIFVAGYGIIFTIHWVKSGFNADKES